MDSQPWLSRPLISTIEVRDMYSIKLFGLPRQSKGEVKHYLVFVAMPRLPAGEFDIAMLDEDGSWLPRTYKGTVTHWAELKSPETA